MSTSWKRLLEQAEGKLQAGEFRDALQLCDRAALIGDAGRYHAALLRGDILLSVGDPLGALSSYETAADPKVPDARVDCGRGLALFELGRFPEAENALQAALRENAQLGEACYALGIIAEIQGTGQEVEYFRKARKLDRQRFPPPFQLAREEFAQVVEETLHDLPDEAKQRLGECRVVIAELPHPDDLRQELIPISPLSMGVVIPDAEHLLDAHPAGPAPSGTALVLYKRNLERALSGAEDLAERIREVILSQLTPHLLPGDDTP